MTYEQLTEEIAEACHAALLAQLGEFSRADLHLIRLDEYVMPSTLTYARDDGVPRHDLAPDSDFICDLQDQVNDLYTLAVANGKGAFTSMHLSFSSDQFDIQYGFDPVSMHDVIDKAEKVPSGW